MFDSDAYKTFSLNECTALGLFSESVHSDDEFMTSSFAEEEQETCVAAPAQSPTPGPVNQNLIDVFQETEHNSLVKN